MSPILSQYGLQFTCSLIHLSAARGADANGGARVGCRRLAQIVSKPMQGLSACVRGPTDVDALESNSAYTALNPAVYGADVYAPPRRPRREMSWHVPDGNQMFSREVDHSSNPALMLVRGYAVSPSMHPVQISR